MSGVTGHQKCYMWRGWQGMEEHVVCDASAHTSPLSHWMLQNNETRFHWTRFLSCSKIKSIKNFEKWQPEHYIKPRESRVIAQVARPGSWPCCQHNFISDKKARSKDQTGILCSSTLRLRYQPSFALQKSKPGVQTDYSKGRTNHCPQCISANLNRRLKSWPSCPPRRFPALAGSNFSQC